MTRGASWAPGSATFAPLAATHHTPPWSTPLQAISLPMQVGRAGRRGYVTLVVCPVVVVVVVAIDRRRRQWKDPCLLGSYQQ